MLLEGVKIKEMIVTLSTLGSVEETSVEITTLVVTRISGLRVLF